MIGGAIPKRYARALMVYAREHALDIEALAREFYALSRLMRPGSDLFSFFSNQLVPAKKKAYIIEQLVKERSLSSHMAVFLRLLHKKGRLAFLPDIYTEFRFMADDLENIVRGEVVMATPLPESVIKSLRDKLSMLLSKNVTLSIKVDPSIVGGILFKVGSLSLDGSIRAHVDSIKEKLSERIMA